jgi:hypothetical protein
MRLRFMYAICRHDCEQYRFGRPRVSRDGVKALLQRAQYCSRQTILGGGAWGDRLALNIVVTTELLPAPDARPTASAA